MRNGQARCLRIVFFQYWHADFEIIKIDDFCWFSSVLSFFWLQIAVFWAIKQMVWTRFPWWWSRDPDTLNTWFPNMECFKGPPYPPLPSGWSRRLCTDPYAASFPPPSPPPLLIHLIQFLGFLLFPLTHMCIVIRREGGRRGIQSSRLVVSPPTTYSQTTL